VFASNATLIVNQLLDDGLERLKIHASAVVLLVIVAQRCENRVFVVAVIRRRLVVQIARELIDVIWL